VIIMREARLEPQRTQRTRRKPPGISCLCVLCALCGFLSSAGTALADAALSNLEVFPPESKK
jgi:hypothetical protein